MAATVQFFGEYLVARSLISGGQLSEGLAYQRQQNLPLGQLAVVKGYLSSADVALIHTEQRRTDLRFGEIAVEKELLDRDQLEELLKGQAERRVYLGEALVHLGHLSQEQLDDALAAFKAEQEAAEEAVQALLLETEGAELVETAIALTVRMFLRMARRHAKIRDLIKDPEPLPQGYRTFAQQVKGEKHFWYTLSMDFPLLMATAAALLVELGEEVPPIVDEVVLDAGKEFVNIVVGHVCAGLCKDGQKVMPEPPEVRTRVPNLGRTRVRVVVALAEGDAFVDLVSL